MRIFETHSEDETIAAGRKIAALLPPRCVVLLDGNLGAGKTTITKGIAQALGVDASGVASTSTFLDAKNSSSLSRVTNQWSSVPISRWNTGPLF